MPKIFKMDSEQLKKGEFNISFIPFARFNRSGGYTLLDIASLYNCSILRFSDYDEVAVNDTEVEFRLVSTNYVESGFLHLVQDKNTKELHLYNEMISGDNLCERVAANDKEVDYGEIDPINIPNISNNTASDNLKVSTTNEEESSNEEDDGEKIEEPSENNESDTEEESEEEDDGLPDFDNILEEDQDQSPFEENDDDTSVQENEEETDNEEDVNDNEQVSQEDTKEETVPAEKHKIAGDITQRLSKKERKKLEKEKRRKQKEEEEEDGFKKKDGRKNKDINMPSGFNASVFEELFKNN